MFSTTDLLKTLFLACEFYNSQNVNVKFSQGKYLFCHTCLDDEETC